MQEDRIADVHVEHKVPVEQERLLQSDIWWVPGRSPVGPELAIDKSKEHPFAEWLIKKKHILHPRMTCFKVIKLLFYFLIVQTLLKHYILVHLLSIDGLGDMT